MAARVDILEQHRDDAAFLYLRLRRSCRLLDGNAAQTRSLLERIDANVDALSAFADDAASLLGALARPMNAGERFVAVAAAVQRADPARERLAGLADAKLDDDAKVAVRDALLRYGGPPARPVVDAWVAEGNDALRCVGVEMLGRWRDPRAAQVAQRAVKRGAGLLRATGACVLGRLGVDVGEDALHSVLLECRASPTVCEEVLDATVHAAPSRALGAARFWAEKGLGRCDMAWVLLGLSGDEGDAARLWETFAEHGPRGALPAALALAGQHPRLDAFWNGANKLPTSNALREAAYVVLGGEAPPAVVRDDMPEEPEDRAQREAENRVLRGRMAQAGTAAWRWGAVTVEALAEVERALSPRPRRWCLAALALAGGARSAVWDDVSMAVEG